MNEVRLDNGPMITGGKVVSDVTRDFSRGLYGRP